MYVSAACAGWSTSAAERMACCQRSAQTCPALSADDCCADGAQRQNLETAAPVLVSPGATVSHPLPVVAAARGPLVDDPRSSRGDPATYLLDSVFLI